MRQDSTSRRLLSPVAAVLASLLTFSVAFADPPPSLAEPVPTDSPQFSENLDFRGLEVPDRVRWVRQWRTAYDVSSDVRRALVSAALEDDCEAVRYEAVVTLWWLLAENGAGVGVAVPTQTICDTRPRRLLGRVLSRMFGITPRSRRCFRCASPPVASGGLPPAVTTQCCDAKTRNALSAIATGCDLHGSLCEPSPRVRAAAAAALALCERAGPCALTSPTVPPHGKSQDPGKHGRDRPDGFKIEEPPPHSGGFEPLAFVD